MAAVTKITETGYKVLNIIDAKQGKFYKNPDDTIYIATDNYSVMLITGQRYSNITGSEIPKNSKIEITVK